MRLTLGILRRRRRHSHRWVMDRMSDYLEGNLPPDEAADVEAHISMCPDCWRVLATLRTTLLQLGRLRGPRSEGIADLVIERLRHS